MIRPDNSHSRVDAQEKLTGRAIYAADFRPANLLIALALRAPAAPARIARIDAAAARAVTGVIDIFTHNDADRIGWTSDPEIDRLGAEGLGREAMGDAASRLPAYRPLTSDQVSFAGQWVAIVVAETIESAREALARIITDYVPLPFRPEPPVLPGPFFAGDMQHCFDTEVETGPVSNRIAAEYHTPMQLHQPMEPSATTAYWQNEDLVLHDSTQGTRATRAYVARSLGIPEARVHVHAPYVGGGFGAKNQIWPHQALAAHLARTVGRPVRLQLTRADMAVASGYRSETRQGIALEADTQGRLVRVCHDSHVTTSLRGGFFEPCGLNTLLLYAARRIEVSHHVTRLPISTPTPFRAPGETPGSFALETAMDELAEKIGIDPIELRLRNFATRDHYHGHDWSSNLLGECYRMGSERIGWHRRARPRGRTRDGRLVGLGMATTAYPAPALPANVRLVLRHNGTLMIETSATDIGTGMRTLLAQLAARRLGLKMDHITVRLGESDLPDAPTAGRSKSTASILPACDAACDALLAELDVIDPHATPLIHQLVHSGRERLEAEGQSQGLPEGAAVSFYSFGAHFVEVELNETIGRLRVTRVVTALDCGRIMNPVLATSQIRGGVIFGLGMALMENARRHPHTYRVMTDNLADYSLPVHADIPPIEVIFTDQPDPLINAQGARGLGEISLPGLAAAVGNALFNACGRRARSLPLSIDYCLGN